MPLRLVMRILLAVVMWLSVGVCLAAADGWDGPGGGISADSQGDTAQVSGSVTGEAPATGPGFGAAPAYESGWESSNSSDPSVLLCRYVNSGLTGDWGTPVRVCVGTLIPDALPAVQEEGVVLDPAALAGQAVARLQVPQPVINLSPQPSDNQWGVLAVGLPIWAWADDVSPMTTEVSEQGVDIKMTANRGTVRFDWGDGTSSVCTAMQPRPTNVHPMTPSPDCGHTYLKRGDYTITATASGAVGWQTLGKSGTLPVTSTATLDVPISEFEAVVVG